MASEKDGYDWNRLMALCTVGLLICAVIPTVLVVWDRLRPPGSPPITEAAVMTGWHVGTVIVAMLLGVAVNLVTTILSNKSKKTRAELSAAEMPKQVGGVDPEKHKQLVDKLNTCESSLRHWTSEVDRVRGDLNNRLETAEKLWRESRAEAGNLGQQLEVAQAKLEGFASPHYRLKIIRAEYTLLGKVGLDVTEILDRMILGDKLVLDRIYNDLFRPDPYPRMLKHLIIEFAHGVKDYSITVPENTRVTLPIPYSEMGK